MISCGVYGGIDVGASTLLSASLEGAGPHALRHSFATRPVAASPGDLRGAAALLGHAGLSTVMLEFGLELRQAFLPLWA